MTTTFIFGYLPKDGAHCKWLGKKMNYFSNTHKNSIINTTIYTAKCPAANKQNCE